jgi:hypothetical protein
MPQADIDKPRPRKYKPGSGELRYARFCQDWLGLDRTYVFDEIAKALNTHKQTLVIGGNGLGKSYGTSALALAALYCNPNTVVPVTAGNGDTVKNSIWKNVLSLWKNAGLPGDFNKSDRSIKTEFDPKWFLECHSPANAEDLEGDHNNNVVYIVEEAEKPGITKQHIDSARSTLAEDDPVLVLCNPPLDESNIVHTLEQRDSWHVLRFPTWESRNARVDRNIIDKPKIGGLSGVGKMEADWNEYHDAEWPGVETAITLSSPYLTESGEPTIQESEAVEENPEFESGLHEKWFKRRVGIMPPEGAEKWRPFSVSQVKQSFEPVVGEVGTAQTSGVDVARNNDNTVLAAKHHQDILIHYDQQGTNHVQQKDDIREALLDLNGPKVAVDAVGEGSGLADELDMHFSGVHRYSNGATANQEQEYRDCWAEALALFGEFLENGGTIHSEQLRTEALAAARAIEFTTKTLRSRGGDVIEATGKDEIKDILGHSPDYLDAALMANWMDMAQTNTVTYRNGNSPRSGTIQR